ncbi:TRAP transporter large permease [Paracoccus sp. SCSIO 75233]|uniref:TRAP transporter large permease n=1 Tax=Paracoccus sp. SCSIO 75233 TaxID=3017782 RepID=UPI0022F04343|nr:TRAP transporter large permease [Paracoccus sp. SCSIO 75233]WBU52031.1 TRAP transporter large permease [Paracoccus sp. SCSIO 75233]
MIALTVTFLILLVLGAPIAIVLGASSLAYIIAADNARMLLVIPQKLYQGTDNFILLAIPFYLLAGELMNATGITQRLIHFFTTLLGHVRGALAQVSIVTSMMFSAISGTAASDAAAVGGVMIPAMKREGYDPAFAAAVQAASSTIAPIIPPSMVMILYAVFANISVAAIFAAGVLPGIILGLSQMMIVWIKARSGTLPPPAPRAARHEVASGFRDALLAFGMPVLILGGILSGAFTATEAAAVAVVYAAILGFTIYRNLTLPIVGKLLIRTAITTGGLLLIAATGYLFAWIMASEQIPTKAAQLMLAISENPVAFLLMVNILLLLLGTFMDTLAALIIVVPMLSPVAAQVGIDPVHFGVVVCFAIIQGMLTPPLGLLLFIVSQIARVRFEAVIRAIMPFLAVNLAVLLAISLAPGFVLFLPRLLGLIE